MPRKPPIRLSDAARRAHERACAQSQGGYIDPETGWFVMSEHGLRERGVCCGNGCRHCPYDWTNVPRR